MPAVTLTPADASEALLRSAQDVSDALTQILAELPLQAAELDHTTTLVNIAEPLAMALATVLDLCDVMAEDDGQLRGALQRWLP